MADETKKVSFKDTLNLPQTDFPIRSNPQVDDPLMVKRWEEEKLYEKSFDAHKGRPQYILHDGPPYANGHIHLGTAYNKIFKDIIGKSQRMLNQQVPITPGWDCHGLPIEHKVTQEKPHLSRADLMRACREYASYWIDVQRSEFKALGVVMNWDHPYLTMHFSYEAKELKALGKFLEEGYLERKNKTVPWCPSCQTVLATAEIEYEERKDPSIYVLFPLTANASAELFPDLADKPISLVVWTTTPWTLPLNRAVLMKPDAEYVVLEVNDEYVIVGKALANALSEKLQVPKKVIKTFSSHGIESGKYLIKHPFIEDVTVPLLLDDSVLLEEGTAFVHSAPGAGPIDYEIGVKNKLAIFSPIGPDGKYTTGIAPAELEGMAVADGQFWVMRRLTELQKLLYKTTIRHSYPHCWRCKGPLIFRATKQWFLDLEKHDLKQKALDAINEIAMIPENSVNRLKATIEGRLEWCISRQRVWGVPIPALICKQCDYTYITKELIDAVAAGVEQKGIEYWQEIAVEQLMPKACPVCSGTAFKKEQDILDVWFDSGVSHYVVLNDNPPLRYPADIYFEGKDQHRGWFQSSLLTSMVLEKKPCTKAIMTHGFVVDDKGRKMSKSLGNVVSPPQMAEKLGMDGFRLWVSSIDVTSDAVVSEVLIKNVQEVFRKIRNTCRFLLSNLYDFSINKDAVPLSDLTMIDQYALQDLYVLQQTILKSYKAYDFTAVFHALGDYCSVNLSAFYLDIIKDRLYVEKADGHARRSAQTACWYLLDTLTRLMAPLLSFTAEQLSDLYQEDKKESIHLQTFAPLELVFAPLIQLQADAKVFEKRWSTLKAVRSAILKAIEGLREQGIIKHPLEGQLTLFIAPDAELSPIMHDFFNALHARGESPEAFFKEFAIVSQVTFANTHSDLKPTTLDGLLVSVDPAAGEKCPRCWQWDKTQDADHLCKRCVAIVR